MKAVYRNQTLWFLSLFYFITFGSFVAFTIYLPNFLVNHFGLDPVDSGLRTAGFIAVATFLRPVGGWLADKFNPLKLLMYVFAGCTLSGILLAFSPSLGLYGFGVLTVAVCAGLGNGIIFKLVPLYFSNQAGIVNGIVSAMGGLGGFFPPLILSSVFSGNRPLCDRIHGAVRSSPCQLCDRGLDVFSGSEQNIDQNEDEPFINLSCKRSLELMCSGSFLGLYS